MMATAVVVAIENAPKRLQIFVQIYHLYGDIGTSRMYIQSNSLLNNISHGLHEINVFSV